MNIAFEHAQIIDVSQMIEENKHPCCITLEN